MEKGQNKGNNWLLFMACIFMCTGFLLPIGIMAAVLYLWGRYFGEAAKQEEYNDNVLREYQ